MYVDVCNRGNMRRMHYLPLKVNSFLAYVCGTMKRSHALEKLQWNKVIYHSVFSNEERTRKLSIALRNVKISRNNDAVDIPLAIGSLS